MNLKNYRAIIFDLFHTLTSLESTKAPGLSTCEILGISRKAWNEQLLFHSMDRLRGITKDPIEIIKKMAQSINRNISDAVIREAVRGRINRFQYALVHIEPSVVKTLKKLKESGKLIGLVSNSDVSEIAAWDNSPIKNFFDSVVFSCHVGYIKPEKEIYTTCLKELNISARESLYVGDGSCDELRGAKEVGMTTVLITYIIKQIWPEKITEHRKYADYEIDKLSELLE